MRRLGRLVSLRHCFPDRRNRRAAYSGFVVSGRSIARTSIVPSLGHHTLLIKLDNVPFENFRLKLLTAMYGYNLHAHLGRRGLGKPICHPSIVAPCSADCSTNIWVPGQVVKQHAVVVPVAEWAARGQ